VLHFHRESERMKSMPEVPRVQKKFRETKFFFDHMSKSARSTRLDHDHLEFYLSAFLSAARSVTDFFESQAWWGRWKAIQSAADILLLKQMTKQRDGEVHKEGADVSHQVEDVPLSKPETPSGLHAAYAPSFGEPWGEVKVGWKVYCFMLGGKAVPVIETCQRYVGLLERAVEDFSKA
jgi:hypothetical protein